MQVGGAGTGEGEGQRRHVEGARVEVGGDDARGVPGGVQRLDPGTRTEVERALHGRPYGDPGQRRGRTTNTQDDALGATADASGTTDGAPEVGHDEPVLAVGPAVRPYVDGRGDLVVTGARQPPALQALLGRQNGRHARVLRGLLQQEQPYERLQRAVPAGRPQGGDGLAPRERRVGRRPEQLEQAVGGEFGPQQGLTQSGDDIVTVNGRQLGQTGATHAPIVTPAPRWPPTYDVSPAPRENGTGDTGETSAL